MLALFTGTPRINDRHLTTSSVRSGSGFLPLTIVSINALDKTDWAAVRLLGTRAATPGQLSTDLESLGSWLHKQQDRIHNSRVPIQLYHLLSASIGLDTGSNAIDTYPHSIFSSGLRSSLHYRYS